MGYWDRTEYDSFWDEATLVCRAMGRYGDPFRSEGGVTQGGSVSPKVFNILVDAIVREWIHQILGDEAATEGYGDTCLLLAILYTDDGYIASRSKQQLQDALDILW